MTESQPDSKPTNDGGLRSSNQLFATATATTTLARIYSLIK